MEQLAVDRRARRAGRNPGLSPSAAAWRSAEPGPAALGVGRRGARQRPRRATVMIRDTQRNSPRRTMVRRCNDAGRNCFQTRRRGGIHIGCSGWVYKHWRGDLLSRRPAAATVVPALRAKSSTRSRSTPASTACRWNRPSTAGASKAPPGFRYAVKVNRFITHMKKLVDCPTSVDRVHRARPQARRYARAAPLPAPAEPPSATCRASTPSWRGCRGDLEQVVEFRHKSWYDEPTLELLDRHGVGFVMP